MHTIVVGVEQSEHSRDAITLARRLAGPDGALLLVCAYAADRLAAGAGRATSALAPRAQAEMALARWGGYAGSRTLAVPDRQSANALARVADELGAAAIVVGSRRTGHLRRVLPGSTGEQLLASASCPVAIAPHGYSEHAEPPIELVACAYNGAPEARRALTLAEAIALHLEATLRVVRVVEPLGIVDAALAVDPQVAAAMRRIRERPLNDLRGVVAELDPDVRAETTVLHGDPAEELVRASFSANLIVTGSRGYGPLHAVLAGAVSGRLIRGAACPVIVVPRVARTRARHTAEVALAGAEVALAGHGMRLEVSAR